MSHNTTGVASSFTRLRAYVTKNQPFWGAIADDLDAAVSELDRAGAPAAATRLRRLDEYATLVPPESLPALVNSGGALDELEAVAAAEKRHSWLVIARNLGALVPLALTWGTLAWATGAYQTEVHQHPDLVYQPFLVLWESGFGGQGGLTFSGLAVWDTLLFASLIALTFFISIFSHQAQAASRTTVARLDDAVGRLVVALGTSRATFSNNPTDLAAAVRQVINPAMQETQKLMRAGQTAMQAAAKTAESASDAIRQTARETQDYIVTVKQESAATLSQVHNEIKTDLSGFLGAMQDDLSAQYDQYRQQMVVLFADTEAALKTMLADSQAAAQQVAVTLPAMIDQINDKNRQWFESTMRSSQAAQTQASDALRDAVTQFTTQIGQYDQASRTLVASMGQIGSVTQELGANARTFAATAGQMDAHVQEVANTQAQFAQRVESAANALGAAAGETQKAAGGMQTAVTQLQGAIQPMSALATDVSGASRQWGNVQQGMEDYANRLQSLVKVLQNLKIHVNWPWQVR